MKCDECGWICRKAGRTAAHSQRWRCSNATCPMSRVLRVVGRKSMGNYTDESICADVRELLLDGDGILQVARVMGVSRSVVRRIERDLRARGCALMCPCGRDARHQGWCRVRYQRSVARSAFIAGWRDKKS